jgi:hypothetical protein
MKTILSENLNNVHCMNKKSKDNYFSIIAIMILLVFSFNSASASNHNTSIFSGAIKNSDSNSFKDSNHSFSIQPPTNWSVLNNLPSNVSSNAIVVFSNNDHKQLATFGIFHRFISQNVLGSLNNHTDNDILATIAQETSSKGPDSQTNVLNGIVDRYTDGIRVAFNSATQYKVDNSTSINESVLYFLNTGDEYTLDLTSNSNNYDKNSKLFENSANTFLVDKHSSVPEFPTPYLILIIAIFSLIFIPRLKKVPS